MSPISLPESIGAWLAGANLWLLLSPSDLVILGVLLAALIFGCCRGLVRTVFGFFTGLAALICAGIAAKAAAPYMARYLVTPIVGEVFERQASAALESVVRGQGDLFGSLTGVWQGLLSGEGVQSATEPLRQAAQNAALSMSESLSYFLLFFILLLAFTALLRLLGGMLNGIARIGPIGCLNSLAGGALGVLSGLLLVVLVLWVLTRFSPATFSPLGMLSPAALDKTLLTKSLLGLIAPAI